MTGSRVRFWPDHHIFLKGAVLDYDALVARARQTSFLVPGCAVIRDERGLGTPAAEEPVEEVFHHDGGIAEFVEFLAPDAAITDVWRLEGAGTFKETVPILDNEGHMTPTELERESVVDIALRWGQGYDVRMQSFVNIITTPKGGTHVAGFEQALLKVFRRQLELHGRRLKVGNDKPEKDDVLAGMTAVVTVRLAEPQFEGQTKEVLGTNAVRAIVAGVVETELTARLTSTKRGDKAQSALLLEKVVSEMKSRISARLHKETQRRKNALESSTLPTKLGTAARPTSTAPSCSSSRATPPWGRPRRPATPSSRRCCRSAARSSTSRRRPSPTCSRTPSAPRSSRSSAPARGAASTSTPPATARSSS